MDVMIRVLVKVHSDSLAWRSLRMEYSAKQKKIGVSRVPLLERGHSADAGRNSELRGQNNDAGGGGGSEVLARSPTFVDC
jgi:hypothetical protein